MPSRKSLPYSITVRIKFGNKITLAFLAVSLILSTGNVAKAQTTKKNWHNPKGEIAFSYTIKCIGPLYSGAAFNRWEVNIKNMVTKDVKCEVSIVKSKNYEVSEAIALEVPAKGEKTVVFMRVDIDCNQDGNVYFNRTSYKKSKTL